MDSGKGYPRWVRIGAKIVLGRIRPLGCRLYSTNRQVMELSMRASWLAQCHGRDIRPAPCLHGQSPTGEPVGLALGMAQYGACRVDERA